MSTNRIIIVIMGTILFWSFDALWALVLNPSIGSTAVYIFDGFFYFDSPAEFLANQPTIQGPIWLGLIITAALSFILYYYCAKNTELTTIIMFIAGATALFLPNIILVNLNFFLPVVASMQALPGLYFLTWRIMQAITFSAWFLANKDPIAKNILSFTQFVLTPGLILYVAYFNQSAISQSVNFIGRLFSFNNLSFAPFLIFALAFNLLPILFAKSISFAHEHCPLTTNDLKPYLPAFVTQAIESCVTKCRPDKNA